MKEFKVVTCKVCGNGFGTLLRDGTGYKHKDCDQAIRQRDKWAEEQATASKK